MLLLTFIGLYAYECFNPCSIGEGTQGTAYHNLPVGPLGIDSMCVCLSYLPLKL